MTNYARKQINGLIILKSLNTFIDNIYNTSKFTNREQLKIKLPSTPSCIFMKNTDYV